MEEVGFAEDARDELTPAAPPPPTVAAPPPLLLRLVLLIFATWAKPRAACAAAIAYENGGG